MEPKRIRPGRRLLNIGVVKAAIETGLVAIASLMVPVLDVRIIQVLHNHTLAVGRVDAGLVAGEATCLMYGRLPGAVRLRIAGQVDVGAGLFFGEAVAGFGGSVGTHIALVFDHSFSLLSILGDGRMVGVSPHAKPRVLGLARPWRKLLRQGPQDRGGPWRE